MSSGRLDPVMESMGDFVPSVKNFMLAKVIGEIKNRLVELREKIVTFMK
jgi:hypothetical protein